MQIDAAIMLLLAYAVLTRSEEQTFAMHRLIAQFAATPPTRRRRRAP